MVDYLTIGGLVGGIVILVAGLLHGGAITAFVNVHGILIVIGGTLAAVVVNCSKEDLRSVFNAVRGLFLEPVYADAEAVIPVLVELCRQARTRGMRSIQDAPALSRGDGFLGRALETCVALGDLSLARAALERDINMMRARHREVGNVLRTMGLLAPMFGLLGTLIGIISVLRSLSNASQAGSSMATAISSAFYGILLSNMFCVPLANKLRSRSIAEGIAKEVVMVGIIGIVFSQRVPVALDLELRAFIETRRRGGEQGAPPSPGGAAAG